MQSDVTIRPWVPGDLERLDRAAVSPDTLRARFWYPVPAMPASYLRSVARRWPRCWDAVVAVDGDRLVGWAEFGRQPGDAGRADVAVCVIDAEQGHGLGTALLGAVVEQAHRAGIVAVHVDIAPGNHRARHVWQAVTGGAAATYALAG